MAAGSLPERARGRELALLALCHLESYPLGEQEEALALLWQSPPGEAEGSDLSALVRDTAVRRLAERLVSHVWMHRSQIDELIEATSRAWRLERMDRVDRNVVRLAVAELAHERDTPRNVVIAEAVRLASRYGSERSARFVNGLVEDLARGIRPGAAGPEHD